jgi:hypothetical protein
VFATRLHYACSNRPPVVPGRTECCDFDANGKFWCTTCDDTQPPSGCTPRYPGRTAGETAPPTNLAPPKVCPDGSSPDANGVCPPVTQGTPPLPPPKGTTGAIEQPPTNLASPSKTSQRAFSPTGGCVPGGTTCIPCDPGLATHGANCIPSGDWRPGSSGLGTELGGGGSSTPPTVQPPPAQSGVTEQPPTNLAPPKVCPDGSSPDANGQCPTTTTGNQNPQSLTNNNNGGGGNGNNNNVQSQQQNNKGSNLLGHAGELAGNKKGSSPTPPPCPTDNSPIPPNCTLKPKF